MSAQKPSPAKTALLAILNQRYQAAMPGLNLREIDADAISRSQSEWRPDDRPVDWDWQDLVERFVRSNSLAIGVALWWDEPALGQSQLVGMMIIDVPNPERLVRLRFLEAYPYKEGFLHKNACKIAMAILESYAVLLNVPTVQIHMAIEGTVKYMTEMAIDKLGSLTKATTANHLIMTWKRGCHEHDR